MSWEKILELGVEGGTITLLGRQDPVVGWRFVLMTNESTLNAFLEEDEAETMPQIGSWGPVEGWEGALALLARYPWRQLRQLYVHPDFEERLA